MPVYGVSRFVIDHYTTDTEPYAADPQVYPFPLNVCLNYRTESIGFAILFKYGIYQCNQSGDAVIFTDYGQSKDCSQIVPVYYNPF